MSQVVISFSPVHAFVASAVDTRVASYSVHPPFLPPALIATTRRVSVCPLTMSFIVQPIALVPVVNFPSVGGIGAPANIFVELASSRYELNMDFRHFFQN